MKFISALFIGYISMIATSALADEGFTFVCEKRNGQRVYADGSEIGSSADSDSAPISFVYRDSNPTKIVMIWSPPNAGDNAANSSRMYEMSVFKESEDKYVAIDRIASEVHVYSIYLGQGLLYHTMHRDWNLSSNSPVAISMVAHCKASL